MNKRFAEHCPFCKAAKQVFHESENFKALYNISPILPGHTLIVPKWHVTSLFELSDAELYECMQFSRKVMARLKEVFGATGYNLTIQEGEEAGQTVPHLHIHLIPRHSGDLKHPGDWYPRLKESQSDVIDSEDRPRIDDSDMKKIVSELRKLF